MKRLELSRLMDEYQDNEFFPEGGTSADTQAVKDRVLANVKPAEPKKRMPRKKKLLIAAALAAALVVLVGAGYPYIRHHLVSGALTFQQNADGSRVTSLVHYGRVMELETGRLMFNRGDGQRIDVTDLISEETPYIYDGSDPETGTTYYIILGGVPDNYGSFEWIVTQDSFTPSADGSKPKMTAGYWFDWETIEQGEVHSDSVADLACGAVLWDSAMDRPWLLSALRELDIPITYGDGKTNTSYVLE